MPDQCKSSDVIVRNCLERSDTQLNNAGSQELIGVPQRFRPPVIVDIYGCTAEAIGSTQLPQFFCAENLCITMPFRSFLI